MIIVLAAGFSVAQMMATITEEVITDFGVYYPRTVEFTPAVPEYSLPADFSTVEFFNQFNTRYRFNETELALLAQNHFLVRHGNYKQFYDIYNEATNNSTPLFITSDAVLHIYHVLFDNILTRIEEDHFYYILIQLTQSIIAQSDSVYQQALDAQVKEAARRNLAFAYTALILLLEHTTTLVDIPDPVYELVIAEKQLIDAHQGFAYSPIFGEFSMIDYSQFVPRGHYTRSDLLRSYFKTMMWYGLIPFTMEPERFGELSGRHTLQALLLTRWISSSSDDEQRWSTIYDPTSFFACRADDPTLRDYLIIARQIYGADFLTMPVDSLADSTLLEAFMAEARKLPDPLIPVYTTDNGLPYKGFRFMGQRQIPDSYMFSRLVFPFVLDRFMPMGLDVMSILGSGQAARLADSLYQQTIYPGYAGQIEKLHSEFAAKDPAEWAKNLYWNWLYSLMPLLYEKGSGYPFFMQTMAWMNKELLSALASWAELRHDTILYAKQSQGAIVEDPPPVPMARSYVEPNPHLYARLFSLTRFTREGLNQQNLLSDFHDQKLLDFIDLLDFLTVIAVKELHNESLSEDEYNMIFSFGGIMEELVNLREDAPPWEKDGDDMAVIADVHTDPNFRQCLEVGVGYPLELFVIVYDDGALRMTRGAMFSYYEFHQPIDNRLTDEQWREQLALFSEPPMPEWTISFMDSSLKRTEMSEISPENRFTALDDPPGGSMVREFRLLPNYPNPFNALTTIRYALGTPGKVQLSIYNLLGQKVATLVNESKPAGNYSLTWDASWFSSGIYYCRLIVENTFIQTEKIVLIK